jgi:hypothetical protein
MESPWVKYLDLAACDALKMSRFRLRKFTPSEPVVYVACASQLAVLGAGPAQALSRFYYHQATLRRDIDSTLEVGTSATAQIAESEINFLANRFRQTLQPGLRALEALAPIVENPLELEATAIAMYDEQRVTATSSEPLRERIRKLLA